MESQNANFGNTQLPPEIPMEMIEQPMPPLRSKPKSLGFKVWMLALQCVVLMIGALIVFGLIYSRETTNEKVSSEISNQWGGRLTFNGISLKLNDENAQNETTVCPANFDSDIKINTQRLHRGVYEAEVYDGDFNVNATFSRSQFEDRNFKTATLVLQMNPVNQIDRLESVTVNGKSYDWKRVDNNLEIEVDPAALAEEIKVATKFTVRGSGGLWIDQMGDRNKITINGIASNPSFRGNQLPLTREINGDSFNARWEGTNTSTVAYPKVLEAVPPSDNFLKAKEPDDSSVNPEEKQESAQKAEDAKDSYYDYMKPVMYVGADFLVGVDRYQKVSRTLKYSFIIILLTYISVLFVELIRKQPIPYFNYFLIGVALILFYSLLLSFSEIVPFGWSYLIAAVMTVGLITGYMGMIMKSKKVALSILGVLSAYYAACYGMLISTYALLIGSLLLFFALALLMVATLKVRLHRKTMQFDIVAPTT